MDTTEKDVAKKELLDAIHYFIERQGLVAQAIEDLGLDIQEMDKYDSLAWLANDAVKKIYKALSEEEKKIVDKSVQRNLPQSGIWKDKNGKQWEYFLHGRGCALTNRETGEPLDWDVPNLHSFNLSRFFYYLTWLFSIPDQRYVNLQKWINIYGQKEIRNLISELNNDGYKF